MTILFTILHVIVCLFLILVVLAQQGKGQDLASAFGGAGSQTAFGARGTATLLSKITAGSAALFVVTSLTLSYLRPAVGQNSVVPDTAPAVETTTEPSTPSPAEAPDAPPAEASEAPSQEAEGDEPAPDATTTSPPEEPK